MIASLIRVRAFFDNALRVRAEGFRVRVTRAEESVLLFQTLSAWLGLGLGQVLSDGPGIELGLTVL